MSYTSNPYDETPEQPIPQKDSRKAIYIILLIVLLASWGYVIYDWTVVHKIQEDQISKGEALYLSADSSRNVIQGEYSRAEARMDSLTNSNTQLTGELAERKKQIDKLRYQIKKELDNLEPDLDEERKLIEQLTAQVKVLLAQIDQLKQQNQKLRATNQQLATESDSLKSQKAAAEQNLATSTAVNDRLKDIVSTLHLSFVNIVPLENVANGMAVAQFKAKKVDLQRIFFQIDQNNFTATGPKDFYVCVTGPDGKPIVMPDKVSGTFTTRDEGDKPYTKKQKMQYTQNRVVQTSIDWKLGKGNYLPGKYIEQIYNNGFKVGEASITLK